VIDLAVPFLALNVWPLVQGIVMTLFVLCALLLVLVILIQEGKGGGIAGAFGGAAAETFGVKAGAVNRFTAILATIFMTLALLHAGIASATGGSVIKPDAPVPSGTAMPGTTPTLPEIPGSPDGDTPPPTSPAMEEPGMTDAPPAMGTETPPAPPAMEGDAAMGTEAPPAPPAMEGDAAMGTEAPPTPPAGTPAPAMGE
jgi:preprotein translocase subunit SecG